MVPILKNILDFTTGSVWPFVRRHWLVLVLASASVVLYTRYRAATTSYVDKIAALQAVHDEEMKKVAAAREAERIAHETNVKELQASLEMTQKQYADAVTALDEKKKKTVDGLVTTYGDDPVALARKISEVTGFKVVLP